MWQVEISPPKDPEISGKKTGLASIEIYVFITKQD